MGADQEEAIAWSSLNSLHSGRSKILGEKVPEVTPSLLQKLCLL